MLARKVRRSFFFSMHTVLGAAAGQGGKFPTIGVVNLATVDLGYPLPALVAALQKFLEQDFVPIWGYPAQLVIYHDLKSIPKDQWQFLFIDDADTAGALGYHDLTKNGQPVSKIFVKTTLADKQSVSVTACHELAEMLIDPVANLWSEAAGGLEYAYEMSDPVEEDTYYIDGVLMSNFVHPAWFEPFTHAKGTKFDHLGRLKKPFSMTKGGYVITKKNGKVQEVFGSSAKAKRFAKEHRLGHRSEHRKPKGQRIAAMRLK